MEGPHILLAERDPDLMNFCRQELEANASSSIRSTSSFAEAQDLASSQVFDVLITSHRLANTTPQKGSDLAALVRERNPAAFCILTTGTADIRPLEELKGSFDAVLVKPYLMDHLVRLVRNSSTRTQKSPSMSEIQDVYQYLVEDALLSGLSHELVRRDLGSALKVRFPNLSDEKRDAIEEDVVLNSLSSALSAALSQLQDYLHSKP